MNWSAVIAFGIPWLLLGARIVEANWQSRRQAARQSLRVPDPGWLVAAARNETAQPRMGEGTRPLLHAARRCVPGPRAP